jgi:prepilin-type N-terminal cleavage/methylation domain-containing protein
MSPGESAVRQKRAFTLIELLVVIAIIGLLVSILLPALGKAKKAAWRSRSLANMNQINAASMTYRTDNKDFFPVVESTNTRGFTPASPNAPHAWCTWSFGGKNPDSFWYGYQSGYFDVEAADRPLNPYLYPEIIWEAPVPPSRLGPAHPVRKTQQADVFRDPSDLNGHQRNWPAENNPVISCYDDVGTTYQWNARMTPYVMRRRGDPVPPGIPDPDGRPGFNWATRQLRISDGFMPSLFVWVFDETPDIVCNNGTDLINGYGDKNKAVLGFVDGHAAYMTVLRGQATGPGYAVRWIFQRR